MSNRIVPGELPGEDSADSAISSRLQGAVALVILGIAIITAGVAIWMFSVIQQDYRKSEAAASDNRTWVISQIEVDAVKFALAMEQATSGPTASDELETVRQKFDILYSRMMIVDAGSSLDLTGMTGRPEWQRIAGPGGILEAALPAMNGTDEDLVAALPALIGQFRAELGSIRELVVDSVNITMGQGDILRDSFKRDLEVFATVVLWLTACIGALLLWLYFQMRNHIRQKRSIAIAAHNLQIVIDSSLDGVLILDRKWRVIRINSACGRLMPGLTDRDHPDLGEFVKPLSESDGSIDFSSLPQHTNIRVMAIRDREQYFPAEVNIATVKTDAGLMMRVAFLRDISGQIAHEKTLAEARIAAEQGEEAKARFLAVMSHEMRTPLSGLIVACDMLGATASLSEEQKWYLDTIQSCGETALEQVNNVLQLTRLGDRDALPLVSSVFSVNEMLADMARQFALVAGRQGTSLEFVTDLHEDVTIELPLQPLRRALSNLLSNAAKFTEGGNIWLRLESRSTTSPELLDLEISVEDTGIGIAEENLSRIFRNFETLDSSFARTHEGSGLGLGIAKLSIESIGGSISAQSSLGIGSRFSLRFEARIAQDIGKPVMADSGSVDERYNCVVLLADDNELNRILLRKQLELLGVKAIEAANGIEAVVCARTRTFDLILMDVSMPHMDGVTAARMIRSGHVQPHVPIIAVTAQSSHDRKHDLIDAGMTDVLIKPVRKQDIMNILDRFKGRGSHARLDEEAKPLVAETVLIDEGFIVEFSESIGTAFAKNLFVRFEEEAHAASREIGVCLSTGNFHRAADLAHRLAGGSAALGLVRLHNLTCRLEEAAKRDDIEEIQNCFRSATSVIPGSFEAARGFISRMHQARAEAEHLHEE